MGRGVISRERGVVSGKGVVSRERGVVSGKGSGQWGKGSGW